MNLDDYQLIHAQDGGSYFGTFGIQIYFRSDRTPTDVDRRNVRTLSRDFLNRFDSETAGTDAKYIAQREATCEAFKKAFADAGFGLIYMTPIPNEYWGKDDPMGVVSPWYTVATTRGFIKVGWRKNVIVLNWSQSEIKASADVLFPKEDVTKDEQMIHAWGYKKMTEYLQVLAVHQNA